MCGPFLIPQWEISSSERHKFHRPADRPRSVRPEVSYNCGLHKTGISQEHQLQFQTPSTLVHPNFTQQKNTYFSQVGGKPETTMQARQPKHFVCACVCVCVCVYLPAPVYVFLCLSRRTHGRREVLTKTDFVPSHPFYQNLYSRVCVCVCVCVFV